MLSQETTDGFLKRFLFKYVCVCVYARVWHVYGHVSAGAPRGQKHLGPLEMELQMIFESPATNAWSQAGVLHKSSVQF